jgi:hypothetical protein
MGWCECGGWRGEVHTHRFVAVGFVERRLAIHLWGVRAYEQASVIYQCCNWAACNIYTNASVIYTNAVITNWEACVMYQHA